MINRTLRLLAILVLAGLAFLIPTSASAIGPDCKDAPAPEAPGTGIGGWFVDAPKTLPKGEAWQNNAPVFEHYGYAGYRWNTYDLGCGADLARSPDAVIGTSLANWLMQAPKIAVGVTNFLVHYAFHPTFLNVFDPMVVSMTNALKTALFDKWAIVFVALGGVMLLWKFRSMRLQQGFTMVGWALLVFMIASAVFQWPLRAGHTADEVVTTVLGSVNGGINGTTASKDPADEVAQSLNSALLYEQWKTGQFGDSNSAIANKYARAMWESQTLTWADAKVVADDPQGAGKRLLDFKAKQYEDTAAAIKSEDPTAYAYISGKRSDDRFGAAFMALFGAVVTVPFLLMASVLMLAAFLLVRMGVVFFPVVATLGVAYHFRGTVKSLGNVMAAAVVNCVLFGVGASIDMYVVRTLLSPSSGLPPALRLILICLVTVIMWVVLKPFRKLTTMIGRNHNVFGDAATSLSKTGQGIQKQALGLGKAALASSLGNLAALKLSRRGKDKEKPEKPTKVAEEETIIEPTTTTTTVVQPEPTIRELPPAPVSAAIGTRPAHTEPAPYERPAAHEPSAVQGTPVYPSVATRPSHNEIGPYQAGPNGGEVVPVVGMVTPPPPPPSAPPVVDRPEYAGGTRLDDRHRPTPDVWSPSQDNRTDEHVGIVDLRDRSSVIDESGNPVWPVWSQTDGVTFEQQRSTDTEPGERS